MNYYYVRVEREPDYSTYVCEGGGGRRDILCNAADRYGIALLAQRATPKKPQIEIARNLRFILKYFSTA